MTSTMIASRLSLQKILEDICENVYYQPPGSEQMKYPAIRYTRNKIRNNFADNKVYTQSHSYMLTVIDKDPDSEIVEKVSQLPNCSFDRHYNSNGMNHDVFILNYK